MTPIAQDPRTAERRALVIAVHRLSENESWKLLRKKLWSLAPPLATSFKSADGYNPHGAAFNDGAQSMTRFILALESEEPDKETEKPEPVAEFRGE